MDFDISIFRNCDFYNISSENFEDKVIENIENIHYDSIIDYEAGASKIVIFFENLDKVIKIPLNCEEHYDEDGELYYQDFRGSRDFDWKSNYIEGEMRIYEDAESENIEKLFLKNIYLGDVNDYPIYAQDYVECNCVDTYKYIKNRKDNSCKRAREISKELEIFGLNEYWSADVLQYYGEETYKKLLLFIENYHIRDLHNGNLGYLKNGAPIIVDYGGYDE